jgi:hypothetical protein
MATPSRITLRDDASEIRVAGTLGAPDATANQVLTADGAGNTSFASPGAAGVSSVTAADTSIVIAGTGSAPTVATGTLDVIAANHPPAAAVAMNAKKITGLADGASAADAVAFHQVPAGGSLVTAAQMNSGAATSGQVPKADGAGGVAYGDAAAGALVLLSSTVLGSNGTFDIQSISQAYNDLIIVMIARGSGSNSGADALIRFNNDSGANYQYNYVSGGGAASSPTAQTSLDLMAVWADASFTADRWGAGELIVPGYKSTTRTKTFIRHAHGSGPASTNYRGGGNWLSDAAINRVQFLPAAGQWITGSEFRIYGRL